MSPSCTSAGIVTVATVPAEVPELFSFPERKNGWSPGSAVSVATDVSAEFPLTVRRPVAATVLVTATTTVPVSVTNPAAETVGAVCTLLAV